MSLVTLFGLLFFYYHWTASYDCFSSNFYFDIRTLLFFSWNILWYSLYKKIWKLKIYYFIYWSLYHFYIVYCIKSVVATYLLHSFFSFLFVELFGVVLPLFKKKNKDEQVSSRKNWIFVKWIASMEKKIS